ncbi:unnamed protein product [Rotaria sp. Silwood1]|nr:unnamed protein product [Rotaria sp. Silwood1]
MRCLNTVNGEGFKQLYQALIDSGYKYGLAKLSKPSVEVLFPDCTNMSRRTKSGENTIRIIKSVLRSYGLDQDDKHVIYLTDNASNFISGLKDEEKNFSKEKVRLIV